MHWQSPFNSTARQEVRRRLYGARFLGEPVQGDLRFSYKMQEAMLKLYADAESTLAPNGCKPQWAKLVSESCAPLARCHEIHGYLASQQGVSQFKAGMMEDRHPEFKARAPAGWPAEVPFWKASQWSTLWMDHVRLLIEHAAEGRRRWQHTLCPDEHYNINELSRLGAQLSTESNASTEDLWRATWLDPREDMDGCNPVKEPCDPQTQQPFPEHPRTFLCSPEAVRLSEESTGLPPQAHGHRSIEEFDLFIDYALNQRGHYFGRKFDGSCAGLLSRRASGAGTPAG